MAKTQQRVRHRPSRQEDTQPRQRPGKRGAEVRRGGSIVRKVEGNAVHEEEIAQPTRELVEVPEQYARVGVGGSSTINLGNFESVQVRVWIELPCAPDERSVQRAYKRASGLVENWIQDEIDLAAPQD